MNGDSANRFISALVKSLQTLCHGYVEFNDGIEIIGHLYLNIDSGSSFDYVVKEKVCKNAENSTVFVSKTFQAQAPPEERITSKDGDDEQAAVFEDTSNMSPTAGTTRLQSAITSISNVLSGASQETHKSRLIDHSSHHPVPQNTGKRKREHNGSYNSMQPPYKYTTLQTSSSSYFSSGPSKSTVDRNHSEHFSNPSHAEFFGGDSNQSSGMGPDDDDDLDLDVTFVKEEYESQRNSSQRGVSAGAASRLSQDPSSSQSNLLHDGTPGGGTLGYPSGHHQPPQQFASGTAGDIGSMNPSFQDSSQVDLGQHTAQGPPNPRSEASPTRQRDSVLSQPETDLSPSRLKLEEMTGISDTLQLGIKLFGPKFVADMASGQLNLPASSDLVNENGTDKTEAANATVFPEMFEMAPVSGTSMKPGHKFLWLDRRDKMKRSSLMRKANLTKTRGKVSAKKASDSENVTQFVEDCKPTKGSETDAPVDPFGVPYRRKRGRPPKRLKMCNDSAYFVMRSEQTSLPNDETLNKNEKTQHEGGSKRERGRGRFQLNSSVDRALSANSRYGNEKSRRIRGSYRQYTAADKLEIVDFGIKYGSTAASRKYNIPESTVRSWTKKMDIFLMQMNPAGDSVSSETKTSSLQTDQKDSAIISAHGSPSQTSSCKNDLAARNDDEMPSTHQKDPSSSDILIEEEK